MPLIDMPAPTPIVVALLEALRAAKYPATYDVTREEYEAAEDWMLAAQAARRAEWDAAGRPDYWPYNISLLFTGRHMGLLLKNVELVRKVTA